MFAGYIVSVKITLNKSFDVTTEVEIINNVILFYLLYRQRYNGPFLSFSLILKSSKSKNNPFNAHKCINYDEKKIKKTFQS